MAGERIAECRRLVEERARSLDAWDRVGPADDQDAIDDARLALAGLVNDLADLAPALADDLERVLAERDAALEEVSRLVHDDARDYQARVAECDRLTRSLSAALEALRAVDRYDRAVQNERACPADSGVLPHETRDLVRRVLGVRHENHREVEEAFEAVRNALPPAPGAVSR